MAVRIKEKAFNKMYAYCKQAKRGEIGGLILGELKDTGNMVVKDVILLKQKRTSSNFEIDDEAMMDFTKNASSEVLSSVLGWWHYHLQFGTFWSADDSNCFSRLTELSNSCLGIVTCIPLGSKKGEMDLRCRLDIYNREGRYISMDGIDYDVEKKKFFNFNFWGAEIEGEVRGLVEEDNRCWISCPKCFGTGSIEAKETKQGKNIQLEVPKSYPVEDPRYGKLSKREEEILDEMVGGQYAG